ncbi:MAG: hypothetical protein KF767_03690 [Bdellovibrionaceae bacterium]|nr:hypothetical protein [Pseudobdellovibrionaceae bacterium]
MRILYITFLLSVLALFQNCSPNEFLSVAAAEDLSSTGAPEAPVTGGAPSAPTAPVIPQTPVAPTAPTCFAPGQKLFADRAFIHYRVCENERADWQVIANRYCCSGEATIIDVETHADAHCAEGRIAGVAYCE